MSLAFVTPTYGPDFERCALLVESLDIFAPAHNHYLIVDAPDLPRFKTLASRRTIVVDSREVMDRRYHRLEFGGGLWWNWRTLPVRGWIAQQIYKLASPSVAPEDVLVMTDSDTTFVKPFTPQSFYQSNRVGLLDVSYKDGMIPVWTQVAERLTGLVPGAVPLRGHVGELICWHREHILGLQSHVESITRLPWQIAIGRNKTFSEYILYGVYIRAVVGYEHSQHAPTARPLVKQPWTYDMRSEAGRAAYFSEIAAENIAVMIHSKDGVATSDVRAFLDPIFRGAA